MTSTASSLTRPKASSAAPTSTHPGWTPLVVVCLGTFMLLLDTSIVNVALPRMSIDFHASLGALEWVADAYALALAALLMLVGSLSDIIGHKRTFLAGLVVFTLASLACGVSPTEGLLIGARVVQGTAAAAMFATTIALINDCYQGARRGNAFGIWGATSGSAVAAGPIIGGLLTQGLSWRWISFVNVPIGIITILIAHRALATDKQTHNRAVDWLGGATFTVSAGTLTYAVVRAQTIGWTATETLILLGAALLALGAFVVTEIRSPAPMFDLPLLRGPLAGTLIAAAVFTAAAFAPLIYAGLWLQTVRGLSPIAAGLATLPAPILAFVASLSAGKYLRAVPARLIIAMGLVLVGGGDLLQFGLNGGSGWSRLIAGFAITGIGAGTLSPVLASAATAVVAPERAGMAAGAVNTTRQLGLAVGIAVCGSVFTARITHRFQGAHASATVAHRVASGNAGSVLAHQPIASRSMLDATIHTAVASALGYTFLIAGIIGIGGMALSLILMSRDHPVR
jgi:EmrB/QacA subfamily drug resistance transporter